LSTRGHDNVRGRNYIISERNSVAIDSAENQLVVDRLLPEIHILELLSQSAHNGRTKVECDFHRYKCWMYDHTIIISYESGFCSSLDCNRVNAKDKTISNILPESAQENFIWI